MARGYEVNFFQRLFEAGRNFDRKAASALKVDRLLAALADRLPASFLTLFKRWGPIFGILLLIAVYAAALSGGDQASSEVATSQEGDFALEEGSDQVDLGDEGGQTPDVAEESADLADSVTGELSEELQEQLASAPKTKFEGGGADLPSWAKPGVPFDKSNFGPRNSWPGVDDKKIRVLFHMTKQSCGDNYSALVSQVLNFGAEWEHTILPIVAYFNARSDKLYANDANEETYFPNGTLYGRVIEPVLEFDDGGPYCEDKARKNGDKAFQGGYGGNVFAAVAAGYGAERFVAENMIGPCVNDSSKKCPIHVGAFWLTDGWYNERRPYAWSHWSSSTRIVQGVASWVAHRQQMSGGKVEYSDQFEGQTRKFGIITQDDPENRRSVKELLALLKSHGVKNPGDLPGTTRDINEADDVVYTPTVLSGRQQAMAQACAFFNVNGYTTIIHQGSVLDPIFMFPACTGQDFRPEWPISSKGYFDAGTAGRAYWDLDPAPRARKQMNGARGVSTLFAAQTIKTPPDQTPPGLAWALVCPPDPDKPHHPMCPKDDEGNWTTTIPDDLNLWYYPLSLLHSIMSASGPDLTPFNGEKFLEEVCNPCPIDEFITQLLAYSRSDHTSIDDHIAWRYNPDRVDPSADQSDWSDEDGDGKHDTPPTGGYEPDTSVRSGQRCQDFRDASTCHK